MVLLLLQSTSNCGVGPFHFPHIELLSDDDCITMPLTIGNASDGKRWDVVGFSHNWLSKLLSYARCVHLPFLFTLLHGSTWTISMFKNSNSSIFPSGSYTDWLDFSQSYTLKMLCMYSQLHMYEEKKKVCICLLIKLNLWCVVDGRKHAT